MDLHGKLLSEGLVRRGHNVSIISTRHPNGKEHEERNGVRLHYLKNTIFGSRRKGWQKESVKKFLKSHRQQAFDVIWSQSFDAFGLTCSDRRSIRIPIIPTLHGSIQQEARTFRTNMLSRILKPQKIIKSLGGLLFSYFVAQRPLLSFSDRIVTVSPQVTEDIRKWYGWKIAEKCVTVLNGIDTSHFRPDSQQRATIRGKYGIDDNDIVLLTLGRLTHEKGHHLAVEALTQLKAKDIYLKLLVVGDGEKREALQQRTRSDGAQRDVIFAGQVDNRETAQYYNSADIFLMPTLTVEGLPFTLLEAMSCGKPVIASEIGGNSFVIRNRKNGLLIAPGNVDQLMAEIQSLVADDKLAHELGLSARRTVLDAFTVEHMVEKTLDIMQYHVQKAV